MDDTDYSEQMRHLLLDNIRPSYITTNRMEVSVRCPFCGDSKKDKTSAHLYISMKPPFMYHCKKCNSHGVVNEDFLRKLQIFNNDANIMVINADKTVRHNSNRAYFARKDLIITSDPDQFSDAKEKYFNGRYDQAFDVDYISKKYHAIVNSEKFFLDNHIMKPHSFDFDHSIGFASADNSSIIFRDITGLQPKRYFNMTLDQNNPDASKIYNISSEVDVLSDEINLVMAEGIFDIIGVYEFFYKGKVDESKYIFAAVCGKDYDSVIRKYVRMGFLKLNVSVYSDADVDLRYFEYLKQKSPYVNDRPFSVYYNTIEKDYGIPKARISLKKIDI